MTATTSSDDLLEHDQDERTPFIDGNTVKVAAPEQRRQIGVVSAVFIIFNRIIGTGYVWLLP